MGRVWRTWVVLLFFAMGTSLITPLIPLYQQDLGFNDTVVTLFMVCYVVALVPSMLTLGQFSDQVGRRPVLLGAIGTLAVAQVIILTEPGLPGLLIARGLQGAATGAFFGTCTAFLVDASPVGRRRFSSALATISVRLGLGLGPGIAGVLIQYAPDPFRLPFAAHLVLLAIAAAIVVYLPETVLQRNRRPIRLSLEVPQRERSVFWRVLVPSGMILSLFDGVALSLVPVFIVRELDVTNYALVGASGFLVLVSGAISQAFVPNMAPRRAILIGLAVGGVAFFGVVAAAPLASISLLLVSVAVTGAACGLIMKGGVDLTTEIAPIEHRGKLLSAYYVACYLGGFSLPLLAIGVLADIVGLTVALLALAIASGLAAIWVGTVGIRALRGLEPPAPITVA
ncbi:MAG: MFS transporter [Thermoleophilia bacterium]|nr:MFS transporter [Thermoleophilia bacterium]